MPWQPGLPPEPCPHGVGVASRSLYMSHEFDGNPWSMIGMSCPKSSDGGAAADVPPVLEPCETRPTAVLWMDAAESSLRPAAGSEPPWQLEPRQLPAKMLWAAHGRTCGGPLTGGGELPASGTALHCGPTWKSMSV